jgi:hypothetical protein
MAAAALTIGFVARGYVTRDDGALVSATATPPVAVANDAGTNRMRPTTTMQAVDAPADTRELRVATQFVLDTRDIAGATTVSIVGDFNDWIRAQQARIGEAPKMITAGEIIGELEDLTSGPQGIPR